MPLRASNRVPYESLGIPRAQLTKQAKQSLYKRSQNISIISELTPLAGVAELADAQDLGSCGRKAVGVQIPPSAPAPLGFPEALNNQF